MQKNLNSVLTVGIESQKGFVVSIETVVRRGLFQFEIIGLANKTISESKQRILSALDYASPEKRQYINKKITTLLSPAGIKKEGSHFDLPIAISYIISNQLSQTKGNNFDTHRIREFFSEVVTLGELTLTGSILPVVHIHKLIEEGVKAGVYFFIIPKDSKTRHVSKDIFVWEVSHISEIVEVMESLKKIKDKSEIKRYKQSLFKSREDTPVRNKINRHESGNMSDRGTPEYMIDSIKGNTVLKRALEISLAGKHHLLMVGEPGSGKSLIAKSARELIPKIHVGDLNPMQINRLVSEQNNVRVSHLPLDFNHSVEYDFINPPFREPHHTSGYSDILGNKYIDGEVVLANKGILFLDELSEVNKRVVEGLRQPLEDKYIQKNQEELIQTDFILIGCMNPCDCGYYNSKNKRCACARGQIEKFQRKMMSPLFQRFDLCINTNVNSKININTHQETRVSSGKDMYKNIVRVRAIQNKREVGTQKNGIKIENRRSLRLESDAQNEGNLGAKERALLDEVTKRFYFSKREIASLLRVARTIADIEGSPQILETHILESLSFKNKTG